MPVRLNRPTGESGDFLEVLKRELSPGRYRHVLNVARWAADLARRHGADPERARLAGLLHDCAKEWPAQRLAAHVARRRLAAPEKAFVRRTGRYALWHAEVSADVARRRFGVRDAGVLKAIAAHTVGRPRMGTLEKILYVADFSAPGRAYPAARQVRALARKNLDAALRETLRCKLAHVLRAGAPLHPISIRMWNLLSFPLRVR